MDKKSKKNKYGFSLIEILAVLLVFAVICIIVIPIIKGNISDGEKKLDDALVINVVNAGYLYSSEFVHDIK